MLSSVNFSQAAADLFEQGIIEVDLFKCPAWPDVIEQALQYNDVYIHFPLRAGSGIGDAIDTDEGQPADWKKIEQLLSATDTPVINLHLAPTASDHPEIPIRSVKRDHVEQIFEALIEDVNSVVDRFGPERVVLENIQHANGQHHWAASLPDVISRVVEEAGCGFLFDLSHARLAAEQFSVDVYDYIGGLPTQWIQEIHLTGIQKFEGHWIEKARAVGVEPGLIQQYLGRRIDHLPMTKDDWKIFDWTIKQITHGYWGEPWVVTFEYGGVGGLFASITDAEVLRRQMPRITALLEEAYSS